MHLTYSFINARKCGSEKILIYRLIYEEWQKRKMLHMCK